MAGLDTLDRIRPEREDEPREDGGDECASEPVEEREHRHPRSEEPDEDERVPGADQPERPAQRPDERGLQRRVAGQGRRRALKALRGPVEGIVLEVEWVAVLRRGRPVVVEGRGGVAVPARDPRPRVRDHAVEPGALWQERR